MVVFFNPLSLKRILPRMLHVLKLWISLLITQCKTFMNVTKEWTFQHTKDFVRWNQLNIIYWHSWLLLNHILLYKVVSFFCQWRRISLSAKHIWFSFTVKLHLGPEMVLDYLILINNYGLVFGYFSSFHIPSIKALSAMGPAASI